MTRDFDFFVKKFFNEKNLTQKTRKTNISFFFSIIAVIWSTVRR